MTYIFTHSNEVDGKIGIGKVPDEFKKILEEIKNEYYDLIPDKNASTYHTWYNNLPVSLKSKIRLIQENNFWNKICDNTNKCIKISASEMDELYYSNPKNNLKKINLYGEIGNYDMHKDCFVFNFNGIKFYRILIGLTDGNDNIITYFNNFNIGHKLNKDDYIIFDFDKTIHQVIKEQQKMTPRILLKIHYIVCENPNYTKKDVEKIKKMYLYYEFITRYIMETGSNPETFYQFFFGVACQYFNVKYITPLLILLLILIIFINVVLKINLTFKNSPKILLLLVKAYIILYLLLVLFYWLRYKLFKIK